MISSAVVIPEQQEHHHSPTLKRRQSLTSETSSKKPRLDTQLTTDTRIQDGEASATSPSARKRSAAGTSAAEEKKRGQRLFGALLGNLSQKSSKPVHRKRDEIEQRQRDRQRQLGEDRIAADLRKKEELDKSRAIEQIRWDGESRRIRHQNMRATANFLLTKSEPRLYYRPWEMRDEEKEQITQQIQGVEQQIKQEQDQVQEHDDVQGVEGSSIPNLNQPSRGASNSDPATEAHTTEIESQSVADGRHTGPNTQQTSQQTESEVYARNREEDNRNKDDDHGELVEGQEDDVIY